MVILTEREIKNLKLGDYEGRKDLEELGRENENLIHETNLNKKGNIILTNYRLKQSY